jgi:membrane-associated phospholipid phosphatase
MSAGLIGSEVVDHTWNPDTARWTGPVLFDESLHNLTKPDNQSELQFWASASDITLWGTIAFPLVDYLLATKYSSVEDDALLQATLITTESVVTGIATTTLLKRVFARKRPGTTFKCDDNQPFDCQNSNNLSFPSGHTTTAFSAAFATCVNHEHLAVHGTGFANQIGCYASLAEAAATGLFRMKSARHYATDVLGGAVVGFGAGYLLPKLLHYTNDGSNSESETVRSTGRLRVGYSREVPMLMYSGRF